LVIFASSGEIKAIRAIDPQECKELYHGQSYLSYLASMMRRDIADHKPWAQIKEAYLGRKISGVSKDVYLAFTETSYDSILAVKGRDFDKRIGDVYISTMRSDFESELNKLFTNLIKKTLQNPQDARSTLFETIVIISQDRAFISVIQPKSFSAILKALPKEDIDMVDREVNRLKCSRTFEKWWNDSYFDATASLTQKFKNSLPWSR
jgi:hypothetical protein